MNNEIAVLMAAGMGTRMKPITETIPKPLVKINGKPMIETLINALEHRGISQIVVVVGYLGSQFEYLKKKYENLSIVENKDYKKVNNISSIHAVTDLIRGYNCFICEADLYVPNQDTLQEEHRKSCYYGKMVKGHSDDWVFDRDENGRIVRIGKVGDDCFNMCGVSYFLANDATLIADAIDERYQHSGFENLFWDEVVDSILDKLDLEVYPVDSNQIVEIDTVEELKQIDGSYQD